MKRMKTKPKGEKKNKGGRPSKYTPEIVAEICRLIADEGKWRSTAAQAVGIDYRTIYDWEQNKPEFSQAIKKAIEAKVEKCLDDIEQIGRGRSKGDWKALAWICERTFRERFSLTWRATVDDEADPENKDDVSIDVSIPSGKSVAVVFRQEASVKEINNAVSSGGPEDKGPARA